MKKICITFFLTFCFFHYGMSYPIQEEDADQTAAEIELQLDAAIANINTMNIDAANRQLIKALEHAQELGREEFIAKTSSLLAQLYFVQHKYEEAEIEYQRAIQSQEEIGDELGKANSLVNFSKLRNIQKDFLAAEDFLNQAKAIYTTNQDTEGLGVVALNRAVLFLNKNQDSQKALPLLREAEKLLTNSNSYYEKSRVAYYFARAYTYSGDWDLAEEEALNALKIGMEHEFLSIAMSSNLLLSNIMEQKEAYKSSLAYLQESNRIRNLIYNQNKKALAKNANARYGVDLLKNQIKQINQINKEHQKTTQFNKFTTVFSIAFILILLFLSLSLFKNNKLRAKANELLHNKNKELLTAKEEAERASLAKAHFLSTITHELRTPLYAVTGLTHLLLEENPSEKQKEHLESLKFSGEYLLSLINNILDLNKLEAKKVQSLNTNFDLKKQINEMLITMKKSGKSKGNTIHQELDSAIPEKIKGDPLIISQILLNLVGNAIKFTRDGDIWIRVKQIKKTSTHVSLRFEIEDNGEGISKEQQNIIFENFNQGSVEINRKFGGTGLGLPIVKNLLHLLDSEIELKSELGKGALFSFVLDLEYIENIKEQQETPKDQDLPIEYVSHKRILIVEDNKINQMITRKILEKQKVICDVADNGTIAIEKLKKNDFDLVLMDIHMPGISGIEATIEIRKFNKEIPIIALTAVAVENNLDQFYHNGFNDIIPKPYKTEEFFHKINKHLAKL